MTAVLDVISGITKKVVSGDGAVCRVAVRRARKGTTKDGGFLGALLVGLATPFILNTLSIGAGAHRPGKGLILPGSVGYGKERQRRGCL